MRALSFLRRLLVEPAMRRRAIVVGLTAALSPLPLVGTLGYESSLLLTAPLALLGVGVGVDVARMIRARPPAEPDASTPWLAVAAPALLRGAAELAGLALAVLLIAQLWNPSCDPLEGLAFFLLGPGLSVGFGAIAGAFGGALTRRDSRRRQLLVGTLPLLASLGLALWRLYADPVVFAHDPFWGSFAGPLYDEAVAITPRYLWFRAYNVVLAAAAVLALHVFVRPDGTWGPWTRLRQHPWSGGLMLALLLLGASIGLRGDRHHFNATVDGLSHELRGTLTTEHFVIHYDPAAVGDELDLIAAEHEFAWHRLEAKVGQAPAVPVHSFVFPDPERKRELIGAGHTEVAPPWRGHLYLNDQPFPHRVLHHELAHAFSGPLGDPLFGIAGRFGAGGLQINLALVEGFAEALAPRPRHGLDLHDQAAVLDRLELRPELESLMGLSFWGKSSRHAYAAAGSFCLWLVETRGVERLAALYGSGGDFPGTYDEPLSELEAQWVAFLQTRPIGPREIEAQRQRYRRKAIFQRPCAHRVANMMVDAERAERRGDAQTSLELRQGVCALEPAGTEHRIELGRALARAGQYDEAMRTLQEAANDPEITHTLASAIDEWLGDLAMQRGELAEASARYEAALERSLEEPVARRLQIKQLGSRDPGLAPLVMDYFAPFEPPEPDPRLATRRVYVAVQIRELGGYGPLGSYLLGTRLLDARDGGRALEAFERAVAPGPDDEPLPTAELVRGAREGLLTAAVRQRDYARARQVLAELMGDPTIGNGDRYTYRLWSERIEFFESYRPR